MKLSIETSLNKTTVEVASHKPCKGCGRSWEECGGGWLTFVGGGDLTTTWECNTCFVPAPGGMKAAG